MQESRRVKLTKRLLKESLLELMEEGPISKIRIKDICDNADVNRTTFYVYYESVEQLLEDIEQDVFEQIPISKATPAGSSYQEFSNMLAAFFDYVQKNEKLFRILLLQTDYHDFGHRLITTIMEKYRGAQYLEDTLMDRYEFMYCANGTLGILRFWLENGFPCSAQKVAELALRMSIQAVDLKDYCLEE